MTPTAPDKITPRGEAELQEAHELAKAVASSVMVLSEDQIAEFKEAFNLFDTDGGGSIGSDELSTVMSSLGQQLSAEDLETMVAEVDADGSGEIDFPEFLTMMARKMHDTGEEAEIIEKFRLFDPEQTGFIPFSAMLHLMQTLNMEGGDITRPEIDSIMSELDENSDGLISYREFYKFMSA